MNNYKSIISSSPSVRSFFYFGNPSGVLVKDYCKHVLIMDLNSDDQADPAIRPVMVDADGPTRDREQSGCPGSVVSCRANGDPGAPQGAGIDTITPDLRAEGQRARTEIS